ncbi:MAG: glycosyltransferase family 2 protein [Polyangiaceae bacterium]
MTFPCQVGELAVFIVVPAFNEAPRIARTLAEIPTWVDEIIVVDDASTDGTRDAIQKDARTTLLVHERNRGVGAAIATGYAHARERAARGTQKNVRDVIVVMAGDGQMDPADLPALLGPIASDEADYVKGDRFRHPDVRARMPKGRYLGGQVFSRLTSMAIGVPISDSQCGYTAITREACAALPLDALWPGFGYPNDLLSHLALAGARIAHVTVVPRYGDEQSKLRLRHLPRIGFLVARAFVRRLAGGKPGGRENGM